ncbi:MAG: carboxypeptidase M32 [Actinomycetota bacterium]
MHERFDELVRLLGELTDVEKALHVLSWDEETKMPPAGADARAEQRATLARIAHELQTSPQLGELLEELRPFEESQPYESFEAAVIRIARADHDKAVRVPADLRADLSRLGSHGYRAWLQAREEQDYSILLPYLERGLELRRQYVECFAPYDDPYDPLLDIYEPGMRTSEVERVFDRLKEGLVPLVRNFAEHGAVDDSCLHGSFPMRAQKAFSLAMLERWGMEPSAWRLDGTVHPFMTCFSPADIRLTTNFHDDSLHGVLSCLHEFGHGVYERNVDPRYTRTPLAEGVSSAFHESQSRLWENLVGRSLATWRFFYPKLQEEFPEHFGHVSLETFHRALNKVEPTLRRVDADEVTYSLHIILRFELERAMLNGELDVRDLPEAFDEKMRDYLGLQPPDIVSGALQDAHWSDLTFGYFPTYALGNVVSVQLWERVEEELGPLDEQFERGEFEPLREWLSEQIYRWGRVFTPEELLQRAAGGPLDPEPYLRYLEGKLGDLLGAAVA